MSQQLLSDEDSKRVADAAIKQINTIGTAATYQMSQLVEKVTNCLRHHLETFFDRLTAPYGSNNIANAVRTAITDAISRASKK